jgi:hypothetical protein
MRPDFHCRHGLGDGSIPCPVATVVTLAKQGFALSPSLRMGLNRGLLEPAEDIKWSPESLRNPRNNHTACQKCTLSKHPYAGNGTDCGAPSGKRSRTVCPSGRPEKNPLIYRPSSGVRGGPKATLRFAHAGSHALRISTSQPALEQIGNIIKSCGTRLAGGCTVLIVCSSAHVSGFQRESDRTPLRVDAISNHCF